MKRKLGGRPPKGQSLSERSHDFLKRLSACLGASDALVTTYRAIHEKLLSKEARDREITWKRFIDFETAHCLRHTTLKGQWPGDDIEGKLRKIKPRSSTLVAKEFGCTKDTIDNWRANQRYFGDLFTTVAAHLQDRKQTFLDKLQNRLTALDDEYKSELRAAEQRTTDTEPIDYVRQRVEKVKLKYLKPAREK